MPQWTSQTVEEANAMFERFGVQVLQSLDAGSFKQVFKAKYRDEIVALKVVRLEVTPDRDEREIRLMHEIDSRYVAKLIDYYGKGLGYHAFVIEEYISGQSLANRLSQSMPPNEFFRVVLNVFDALLACAEKNIVHRDVKPGNILVRDTGEAVLTDFGLGRFLDETTVTATGTIIGTIEFAPPEFIQYNSDLLSESSDLFSLGVMMYWALTGHHPFIKSQATKVSDMLEAKALEPVKLVPGFNPSLSKFIMILIRRDKDERYASTAFAREKFRSIYKEIAG